MRTVSAHSSPLGIWLLTINWDNFQPSQPHYVKHQRHLLFVLNTVGTVTAVVCRPSPVVADERCIPKTKQGRDTFHPKRLTLEANLVVFHQSNGQQIDRRASHRLVGQLCPSGAIGALGQTCRYFHCLFEDSLLYHACRQ